MVDAELAGNKDAYDELRQTMIEAYSAQAVARANWRHAQGLPASDVSDSDIMQFSTNLDHLVSQNVAAARASTQPASRPAAEPASKP
jgi:hypothetical protein